MLNEKLLCWLNQNWYVTEKNGKKKMNKIKQYGIYGKSGELLSLFCSQSYIGKIFFKRQDNQYTDEKIHLQTNTGIFIFLIFVVYFLRVKRNFLLK